MSVSRIQRLDINNRELFTGIYGYSAINEYYVDKNLSKYHLWQELYTYLHELGYITVFYNMKDNFFSYQLRDLELFFRKISDAQDQNNLNSAQTNVSNNRPRHSRCRGPLGMARPRSAASAASAASAPTQTETNSQAVPPQAPPTSMSQLSSNYGDIIVGGNPETGAFYRSKSTEDRLFDRIFQYVDDHRLHKLVVVFTHPETTTVRNTDIDITELKKRNGGHAKTEMPLRLLVLYSAETVSALMQSFDNGGNKFFFNQYFKNLLFSDPQIGENGNSSVSDSNLFHVTRPGVDEIANVLNRRRIMEGMKGMFNHPLDTICRNLWQNFPLRDNNGKVVMDAENKVRQVQSVTEMMSLTVPDFELALEKIEEEGGRKKFDQLLGIDELRSKLDAYIKAFHDYREGKIGEFNPHIALTGNPGTGKTTVARLIGQILREEGLLSSGHMIETNPGGLIGQYIGETRVKTSEVCQQARGGILFVDEAYGLCREDDNTGGGNASFGKEAVEALLTFMLPAGGHDSVVILAGYPKEIEYMLNNGNPGLARRVPYVWNIADYTPDVLYQIGMMGLRDRETTEEFRTALKMIFAYKYAMRNKNWGNAGDANKIVQTIITNYLEQGKEGPISVDSIPADLMRVVKDISQEEEDEIMRELDQLIGLRKVKQELRDLVTKLKVQRYEMRTTGVASTSMEKLNYVFRGNPGTGKTTVARMLGKILYGFGALEYPDVVEADVQKINSGDPAKNLMDFMDKAVGKVLFIDEAYSLINQNNTIAIDALTNALTKEEYKGKMAVVLAGYSADMNRLLEANQGMTSRFTNQIHFEDYTNEELWQVLKLKASSCKPISLSISEECHPYAVEHFSRISREKFSNAREAENLMEKLNQKRLKRAQNNNLTIDDENFSVIIPQDFESYGFIDPLLVKIDDGSAPLSPMEKLNKLQGIDEIREQFTKFVERFRYAKMHPQEVRFRPHMAFLGNPGTGKTTVARIFGAILREEHLLDNGNFIEAKAEDFIAGYVGQTQPKAQAKCKEARGGVMFIDEAHHLFQGEDEHGSFAKEALRVILTELESRTDTLFIFAGYTREMNEFLDKSDPGMRSRVQNVFEFKDYGPSILNTIVRSHFKTKETTPEFDKMLGLAIENIYNRRNPYTFGNARDMEIVANDILSCYRDIRKGEGPLDVDCVPAKYLGSLIPLTPEREAEIRKELHDMIGLEKVKETLNLITGTAKGLQQKIMRGLTKKVKPENLTFLFMGNPGTGKTTVARMLGKILHGYGLLDCDEVKIYSKSDIIDKYVGGTQKNVTKMFNDCFGRVMFIDEAYMLAKDEHGKEALDQITANMTDSNYMGKMAIVMAGYTKDINDMLNANAGLSSRFRHHVMFEDYSNDQLWTILESNLTKEDMFIDKDSCKPFADAFFDFERRKGQNFGNVRVCNNLCETLKSNQTIRIGKESSERTNEELMTIQPEDFPNFMEVKIGEINDRIIHMMGNPQPSSVNSYSASNIAINCSHNDPNKRVHNIQDLDYAVGLLHSEAGEGTGFIVSLSQKYILTCSHVVEGGNSFEFRMKAGAFTTRARVLWNNYEQDMALLEVDALPEDVRFLEMDSEVGKDHVKLTELILCGYPDGSAFANGVSLVRGAINNYEKNRQWNDRCFDTIYANMSATHGCSGGPVVRSDDFKVVGLLQGGKEGGEIQFITDIHQLFNNLNIIL